MGAKGVSKLHLLLQQEPHRSEQLGDSRLNFSSEVLMFALASISFFLDLLKHNQGFLQHAIRV